MPGGGGLVQEHAVHGHGAEQRAHRHRAGIARPADHPPPAGAQRPGMPCAAGRTGKNLRGGGSGQGRPGGAAGRGSGVRRRHCVLRAGRGERIAAHRRKRRHHQAPRRLAHVRQLSDGGPPGGPVAAGGGRQLCQPPDPRGQNHPPAPLRADERSEQAAAPGQHHSSAPGADAVRQAAVPDETPPGRGGDLHRRGHDRHDPRGADSPDQRGPGGGRGEAGAAEHPGAGAVRH